ncbi:ABC transporter ATP-binding protein [Ascidiaceihabitans sp.]|uniref:ABC transporter ATP-binding protein n=1 Tax=Ascidiaceihabitans sp. TaxID=1872644 RepID=UPI003298F98A
MTHRLSAEHLGVTYDKAPVLSGLSLEVPNHKVTVIVGPNACGKSTLLRSLARLQSPTSGHVNLDGKAIHRQNSRSVAKRLAILPQAPVVPEGLQVQDLVTRGRTPHQSAIRQWSQGDAEAVENALSVTNLSRHAQRPLSALSGGQRQRAWIAMTLAQDTDILLLDEPTTYLDLPHQIELLKMVKSLNQDTGRTIVMVLHDINLAARFADHIVALKDGVIVAQGSAADVITPSGMRQIFDLECMVIDDPLHHTPHVIPS